MIEPQTIGATGTTTVGVSASPAARPQEKDVEVREAISLRRDVDGARNDNTDKAPTPVASAKSAALSSPRARIGYSFEKKEPYIEILNPRTGDVIQRIPAEDAENELRTFTDGDAGVFVDHVA